MVNHKVRSWINYSFFIAQLITLILFIASRNHDFIFGVVVTTISYGIYLYLERKYQFFTSNYILGGLVITLVCHHFIGEYLRIYEKSFVFDKALHVFGTYMFAIFAYGLLIQLLHISFTSTLSQVIFVVLLGVSIGAAFEILEFVLDKLLDPEIPYQTNLLDTNLDIISDTVGAIIAALFVKNKYRLIH